MNHPRSAFGVENALRALAAFAVTLTTTALHAADGAAIYGQVCIACHQAGATGAPGLAPALTGTLAAKADAAPVRGYLASVVVHGLSGRIVVDGATFNSAMPAQAQLSDEDVAAVLTHVVNGLAGKSAPPFTSAEVAAARAAKPSAKDLRTQREALAAK